ncbi:MAG: valine--tRNA ligase, partial [Jatrophihabitantaceae bacterium]|nr:valine--tRNA ligase [Jatrophihabitantaceae bacterium]
VATYRRWEAAGYFTADPSKVLSGGRKPFSIVLPPPNVTGSLHIGHALDHTIMDILTRWHRMSGDEALWLPGMDHAGIATQNVVERELAKDGLSRHDLGREKFVERVWEWKDDSGGRILDQMRRLGDGVDWTRERFTMDAGLTRAVQTVFKRMFDEGLIYRAERIINWCPRDLTALSDIEVDHSDDDGELVSIRYGDGPDAIVVATTRAETMLGDTGVAVHPDDPRYAHLVGTMVELPLTGRLIPIVADAHVDPEFGTGAVKVTPAHDPNDFEIGQRHGLANITVMDDSAAISVEGPFFGLDRFAARAAVVEALRAEGRIVAEKRPYSHAVGHCSRCDTVIEPRLSMQWWVKVEPLAAAAASAVRDGTMRIHPPSLAPRYFDWVDNMHDWCISRQLWWGHRIPVWHGPDGEMVCVGPGEEPPTDEGWSQSTDVLDTWFSSGLWPFSTLGWPDKTADLAKFYPTSVLVTGYDILFFWVVRMMMFGLYAMDGVAPFEVVALHGLVRDKFGKKMSKSRGNIIDPLEWMNKYGSDALRFSLARGANPGGDQAINEEWVDGAQKFCNKLWNATRFAMINGATVEGPVPRDVSVIDAWILSRLHTTIAQVDAYLDAFEMAKASELLYHFAWDEVCDWYLELAKVSLGGEDEHAAASTRRVIGEVFDSLLRLLHPMIPFVTETVWTALTGGESLVISAWPVAEPARHNAVAEAEVAAIQSVVTEVRRLRSDQGVKPSARVPAQFEGLQAHESEIRFLLRLGEPDDAFARTASVTTPGGVVVWLDLSSEIDVPAERARYAKDLAAAEKERAQNAAKLTNEAFIGKAPNDVVAKVRDRLIAAEAEIARITAALAALPAG